MPNFIQKKWQERKDRLQRESNDRKMREVADRNAKNEAYWPEYRKAARERYKKQAQVDASPSLPSSGSGGNSSGRRESLARAGNAAQAGLNFLSGGGGGFDMGGGGGTGIADNVNAMLDMGFGGSSKSAVKPKAKRTVINSGGKKIVITEQAEGFEGVPSRKKGSGVKGYFDNLQDIMDQDLPW